MHFKRIAHLALHTVHYDEMIDFYCGKLGLRNVFTLTFGNLYELALNSKEEKKIPDEQLKQLEARGDEAWLTYIEIADRQFIEIFNLKPPVPDGIFRTGDSRTGYTHMSIEVDDIKSAVRDLKAKGVLLRSDIGFGPDFTYQCWLDDPDGNQIELMEYSDRSMQLL